MVIQTDCENDGFIFYGTIKMYLVYKMSLVSKKKKKPQDRQTQNGNETNLYSKREKKTEFISICHCCGKEGHEHHNNIHLKAFIHINL